MIANRNKGKDYLDSIRDGSFKFGLGIGCDLDNYLRYKQGSFNVIAGHANTGKTKFILYYYLCLAVKHNLTFLIFSSENSVGGIKRDLIQLHSESRIEDLTAMQYEYHYEYVSNHFKFIDFEEFYNINKRFMNFRDVFNTALEECINFDALVIDPYNSLAVCEDIKGNSHERDYQIASEFRMFCKKNNKTIYLLAHGNTDALRKQYPKGHSFEGHPIPLMAADIEGGGKWVNRADDFIVIHRLTQHETEWMNTEVHVKKVKETETGGNTTFMDSPIIFKLQKDQLSFICYTRSEPGYVPEVVKNPLSDKPQPQQKEIELKPNEEFEQEVEEVKPIQIPKQQKEDWVDDIFTEEKWTL